jgi:hypothetical protein
MIKQLWFIFIPVLVLCACSPSEPVPQIPPMTPEGIAVQKQFSNLNENDQLLIVQDWQAAQEPEDGNVERDEGYDLR